MQQSEQHRLADAFAFALEAHGDQTRKGVAVPYASHLLQVAGLVLECGGSVTEAVAALLHDTIEDCEAVDAAALRERFGDDVAAIVTACTDLLAGDSSDEKSNWGTRKRRYLDRLESSGPAARRVAACDKLHNLRALVADLRAHGVGTLTRFTAAPENTRWYYESAHRVLRDALPAGARTEFDRLVDDLAGFVPRSEAPPIED